MNRSRQDGFPAQELGTEAGRILAHCGSGGKILSPLSGCIYLQTDAGEIFWVGAEPAAMHRRCVRTSFLPAPGRVRSGQRFRIEPFRIAGDAFAVDLCGAKEWSPFAPLPKKALPPAEAKRRCEQLGGFFQCLNPGEGLIALIPELRACAAEDSATSRRADIFSGIDAAILEIAAACRRRDLAGILETGKDLIGFGPGLTPSGDDFMGGLLFSAYFLQRFYPEAFPWDPDLVWVFLDEAQPRTNPISHALLCDFACGYAPSPLEVAIEFLLQGGDFGKAVSAAMQMLRLGHSSGGDMLAGLMTGMLMVPGTPRDG